MRSRLPVPWTVRDDNSRGCPLIRAMRLSSCVGQVCERDGAVRRPVPTPNRPSARMLESTVTADSLRLIAVDIDGTLLNPEFHISETDLAALRSANERGIEVILVTGRRHAFALPVAQQLGFDLWLICSNRAVTRSLSGETFHRDLLPQQTCLDLCMARQGFT